MQGLLIFDSTYLIPTDGSQAKVENFLKMGLFLLPFFVFFRLLIRERDLKEMKYDDSVIKRGYVYLVLYIVASFSLMIILALYKNG